MNYICTSLIILNRYRKMNKLKKGDSVVIKGEMKDPDFEEYEIGGWQGRVIDIERYEKRRRNYE